MQITTSKPALVIESSGIENIRVNSRRSNESGSEWRINENEMKIKERKNVAQ
jgi:hypothetical protein